MHAIHLIRIFWAIFFSYWFYSGRKTKATALRESRLKQLLHLTAMVSSFVLVLSGEDWPNFLLIPLFQANHATDAIGVFLSALGVSIAIWSRVTLGKNWSAAVSLKKEHEIIQRGPYKLIRHPIYTGIFTNIVGSAIVAGETRGLLAILLVWTAYQIKIRREEVLLSENFPSKYPEYMNKTWKLFPYLY